MSRVNKVNPSQYKLAGRLAPDDAARERVKQGQGAAPEASPQDSKSAIPARAPGAREKGAAQAPRGEAKARTRTAGRSRG